MYLLTPPLINEFGGDNKKPHLGNSIPHLHMSPPDPDGSEGDSQRPTEGEETLFDSPDTAIMKLILGIDIYTYFSSFLQVELHTSDPNQGQDRRIHSQDQLIARLAEDGYHETDTECLFKHDTRGTLFMLVVDDFGIKTKNIDDLNHLIATLSKHYKITIDPTGSKYLGMDIEHDRTNRLVSISMPRYVPNALKRFNIDINSHPQHTPHSCTTPSSTVSSTNT